MNFTILLITGWIRLHDLDKLKQREIRPHVVPCTNDAIEFMKYYVEKAKSRRVVRETIYHGFSDSISILYPTDWGHPLKSIYAFRFIEIKLEHQQEAVELAEKAFKKWQEKGYIYRKEESEIS